jgi:hypothetical protein
VLVVYNGVALNVIQTQQFRSEAVYDDSGTDLLYVKHTIAVIATLSGEVTIDQSADLINNPIANPALTGALNTAGGGLLGSFNNSTPPPPTVFGIPIPTPQGTVIEPSAQLNPVAANNGIPSTVVGPPTDYNRTQRGMTVGYRSTTTPINHYDERILATPRPIAATLPEESSSSVGLTTFGSELPLTPVNQAGLPVEYIQRGHGIAANTDRRIYRIIRHPQNPILTHRAIRERLLQPRGQLWVFDGFGDFAALMLGSPEVGFLTDCKNGPTPLVVEWMDAVGTHGNQYGGFAQVMFVIETYVSENVANGVINPRTLISNRFSMTHHLDDSSYLTIAVTGKALFRTDWEYRFRESPDLYRPLLFLPIPLGFVREEIQVDGLPDTTGVSYSYRDRQVASNFAAGPYAKASSIHALYRSAITTNDDVANGVLSAYERFFNYKWLKKASQDDPDPQKPPPQNVNPQVHQVHPPAPNHPAIP